MSLNINQLFPRPLFKNIRNTILGRKKFEMLKSILRQREYFVWDAKTGKRISASGSIDPELPVQTYSPAPDIIVDAIKKRQAVFIICPDPISIFAVLFALGFVPRNFKYVVGFYMSNRQRVLEKIFMEIPEDLLLVGYDGSSNLGRFSNLFEFSLDPDKRGTTLKEVPEEQSEMLKVLDNERCLESIIQTSWTARAFGFAFMPKLSNSQKQDVLKVLGCNRDVKFFDDSLSQEKRNALVVIDNISNPLLADDVNDENKIRQAKYRIRSRIPELTAYRLIWLEILKEEAERLAADGVEFKGELPAEKLAEWLSALGKTYGVDSMMRTIDAGVPAEDIVLDSFWDEITSW